MDWAKVDAVLAAELARGPGPLTVFVHLDPSADPDVLAALDIVVPEDGGVVTATISRHDLDRLTEEVWVRRVRLGTRLRPIGGG